MRRIVFFAPLLLMLMAACAEPATTPRPRTAQRAEPRRVDSRASVSPLAFSDGVMKIMAASDKVDRGLADAIIKVMKGEPGHLSYDDLVARVTGLGKIYREQTRAYKKLARPTSAAGREVGRTFEAYQRNGVLNLKQSPTLFKLLYDRNKPQKQRVAAFMKHVMTKGEHSEKLKRALYAALCAYVKSHGVQPAEYRYKPCLKGGNIWVVKAQALGRHACACDAYQCARNQQAELNDYIRETKGVKVSKKAANKVAKAVLKAQMCISKMLLREKLEGLKHKTRP